jgi:hypothetical protein
MRPLFLTLAILAGFFARAQQFSYVYIQGDKETPIYVKLEDEMQARYGQNYCIIPRLAPGIIHLQVLFQQNKFPPQNFTVVVPEHGQRSFLVTKKDDAFALYDLRQGFYLRAGNEASEDRLPAGQPIPVAVVETPKPSPVLVQETPKPKPPKIKKPTPAAKPAKKGPDFINGIELGRSSGEQPLQQQYGVPDNTQIANDDKCGKPMDISTFGNFYGKVLAQTGLEARLTFLMDSDECPSPDQARIIARSLSGEEARLRYLGRVLRRSVTPRMFASLESLFTTPENKSRFRQFLVTK